MPGLTRSGVPRQRTGVLGHAVDLREGHADGADTTRASSTGIGAAPVIARFSSSRPTRARIGGEGDLVEEGEGRPLLVAEGGIALERALGHQRRGGGDGVVELRLLLRVGSQRGLDARGDLLPDARHAEADVGADLAQILPDLPGVGAAGDGRPAEDGVVVAGLTLGDVGHRQVGHDPHAGQLVLRHPERPEERDPGPQDVVVGDHHALGRTRRARRVDQRGEVVGLRDGGRLDEVDRVGGHELVPRDDVGRGTLPRHEHDRVQGRQLAADLGHPLEEPLVLDDDDLGLGMADQVLDLVRRRGVVDREGRGAEER